MLYTTWVLCPDVIDDGRIRNNYAGCQCRTTLAYEAWTVVNSLVRYRRNLKVVIS